MTVTTITATDLYYIVAQALPDADVDDLMKPTPITAGPDKGEYLHPRRRRSSYQGTHVIYLPGDAPEHGFHGYTLEDAHALMEAAARRGHQMPEPDTGRWGTDIAEGFWWPSVHITELIEK